MEDSSVAWRVIGAAVGIVPIVFSRRMARSYIDRQVRRGRCLATNRDKEMRITRLFYILVGVGILTEQVVVAVGSLIWGSAW